MLLALFLNVIQYLRPKFFGLLFIFAIVLGGISLNYFLFQRIDKLTQHYQIENNEFDEIIQDKISSKLASPKGLSKKSKTGLVTENVWCESENYKDLSNHVAFRNFNIWSKNWKEIHVQQDKHIVRDPRKIRSLAIKGKELAQKRAEVLQKIIRGDPQTAIRLALPEEVTKSFPQSILKHIEKWENSIADLSAIHV